MSPDFIAYVLPTQAVDVGEEAVLVAVAGFTQAVEAGVVIVSPDTLQDDVMDEKELATSLLEARGSSRLVCRADRTQVLQRKLGSERWSAYQCRQNIHIPLCQNGTHEEGPCWLGSVG